MDGNADHPVHPAAIFETDVKIGAGMRISAFADIMAGAGTGGGCTGCEGARIGPNAA